MGSVRIVGLNKLIRDLRAAGLEIDDLKETFGDIAAEGARVAAGFAPRRTGRLRASLRGNRAQRKAVITAGRQRTTPYAGAINYGWRAARAARWVNSGRRGGGYPIGIAPSFFMQRADEVMSERSVDMLVDGIERAKSRRGL